MRGRDQESAGDMHWPTESSGREPKAASFEVSVKLREGELNCVKDVAAPTRGHWRQVKTLNS